MTFAQYLAQLLRERDVKPTELAKKIGVSLTYVMTILSGKTKPPTVERCQQIAKSLDLSDAERAQFVQAATLGRADEEHRPFLEEYFRRAKSVKELPPEAIIPKGFDRVPILGEAPAGEKSFVPDAVERWIVLPKEITKGKRTYLLRVKGDSMVGAQINDGDLVIVDAEAEPEKGQVVVARVDSETTIKKFYRYGETIVLEPANPKYEKQEYTKKNDVQLRGVVKGVLWKGFLK